jgi:hypothetical protein
LWLDSLQLNQDSFTKSLRKTFKNIFHKDTRFVAKGSPKEVGHSYNLASSGSFLNVFGRNETMLKNLFAVLACLVLAVGFTASATTASAQPAQVQVNAQAGTYGFAQGTYAGGVYLGVGYGYYDPWALYSPWYGAVDYFGNLYGFYYYPWNYYRPTFAAIAWSPSTNSSGYSYLSYTREDALSSAVAYCGQEDCRPVVWVAGGCAAIAVGHQNALPGGDPERPLIGWGYHTSRVSARRLAMRGCRNGSTDCRVHSFVCTQ